jgi:putative heme-binding domain-containing protein
MTYKLGADAISSDKIREYLLNDKLLPSTRSKALAVYIPRKEKDLLTLLEKLAEDPMDEVAISAMKGMASVSPEEAIASLEKAIASGDAIRTQKAWPILAVIPDPEVGKYIITHLTKLQAAEGISSSAIELLAAAKSRKEPEVKKALTGYDTYFTEKSDSYAKYNIALEGGDSVKGFSLFKSLPAGQCMRCHKASDKSSAEGGDAGPNLAGVGKLHDRKYLLQSLVNPSAIVAPGFGITSVNFKNSANLVGNLVEETPDSITVSTPENTWSIKRSDITSFTPPVSAMPPMAGVVKPEELRDLVAWLASLETKTNAPKPVKVEALDPASLLKAK